MKEKPELGLQFDPRLEIANYVSPNANKFHARFGKPTSDMLDFQKAPARGPAWMRVGAVMVYSGSAFSRLRQGISR